MFDDLSITFYNNVVAAYDDYASHRDSREAGRDRHLRTAVAAAVAVYHFREHLPSSLGAGVRDLEQSSSDYALLRGVTNASKHKQPTRKNPLVAKASDIRESTVIVRYADVDGEYSHAQTVINVTCTDGTTQWLDPAITRVLNLWGTLLRDAAVCGFTERSEPERPGDRYLTRSETSMNMSLEAMQGIDFRQTMQLLRFDNALGRAVHVDLTGANVEFRIYKPPQHIVDVVMSHPEHGDVTASIPLSEAENVTFYGIENEADHKAFMDALFQAHRSEIEGILREKLIEQGARTNATENSTATKA